MLATIVSEPGSTGRSSTRMFQTLSRGSSGHALAPGRRPAVAGIAATARAATESATTIATLVLRRICMCSACPSTIVHVYATERRRVWPGGPVPGGTDAPDPAVPIAPLSGPATGAIVVTVGPPMRRRSTEDDD